MVDGQGLPWPKPAYLKRLAYQEKSRVQVLRLLEEKLGTREAGSMVMASSEQIIAVVSESLGVWPVVRTREHVGVWPAMSTSQSLGVWPTVSMIVSKDLGVWPDQGQEQGSGNL